MNISENDFEINIDNINIEEIMAHIRENIKKRGYEIEEAEKNYDFIPDNSYVEVENSLNLLLNTWNINLEKEMSNSPGIIGKIKGLIKRSIRKIVRPYFKPIMSEQLAINGHLTRIVDFLYKQMISNLENRKEIDNFNMNYLAFEDKYRGSEKSIQKLQEKFVKLYAGKDNILDIGCGRGEFMKTLLNSGKRYVFGMDINPKMVEKCKKEGLSVELKDGVSYLYDNNNLNLGGIFSSQVIEHLKPSQIVKLIKGAYKNLQEGSPLILETINPMALVTQTMAYTLDLTHRQYVHPFTIEMLLKEHGFKKVEFIYSSPIDTEAPILKANGMDQKELEKYNEKIKRMYEILFGYQDYAAIAWK